MDRISQIIMVLVSMGVLTASTERYFGHMLVHTINIQMSQQTYIWTRCLNLVEFQSILTLVMVPSILLQSRCIYI